MSKLLRQRSFVNAAVLTANVVCLCAGVSMLQFTATAQDAIVEAPIFEVDPLWPKPIPNEGLLGMTIGASVDAQDNVWIVHRGAATQATISRHTSGIDPAAQAPRLHLNP